MSLTLSSQQRRLYTKPDIVRTFTAHYRRSTSPARSLTSFQNPSISPGANPLTSYPSDIHSFPLHRGQLCLCLGSPAMPRSTHAKV